MMNTAGLWRGLAVIALCACGNDGGTEAPTPPDEYFSKCETAAGGAWQAFEAAIAAGTVINDDKRAVVFVSPRVFNTVQPPHIVLALPGTAAMTAPASSCQAGTGETTYLVMKDARAGLSNVEGIDRPLYSAILSVLDFTPTQTVWQKKIGARIGTMKLWLYRATFSQGTIVEGPFAREMAPEIELLPVPQL